MDIITRRSFVTGSMVTCGTLASTGALGKQRVLNTRLRLGVNLAGAEFKAIGGRWKWPSTVNLNYYLAKGFNIFRVPFLWQRLQLEPGAPLDESAMTGLDRIVELATSSGAVVMLDCHNYGRHDKTEIGSAGSPFSISAFANFWGRIARRYRRNTLVWYNLMNEPHDQDPMLNLAVQNAACASIRRAGATSKVLFSGIDWSGAKSWISSKNGKVMLGARDPANNFAFDVHQYLERAHISADLKDVPGIGSRILSDVYDWAKTNNRRILLGEFGVNSDPRSMPEVEAMLAFMAARTDVFIGATYFAGGGTWGKNPNSADPIDGVDKPQTEMMRKYL